MSIKSYEKWEIWDLATDHDVMLIHRWVYARECWPEQDKQWQFFGMLDKQLSIKDAEDAISDAYSK